MPVVANTASYAVANLVSRSRSQSVGGDPGYPPRLDLEEEQDIQASQADRLHRATGSAWRRIQAVAAQDRPDRARRQVHAERGAAGHGGGAAALLSR